VVDETHIRVADLKRVRCDEALPGGDDVIECTRDDGAQPHLAGR